MSPRRDDPLWNHSTHYHPHALRLVTPMTRSALDVGCGEGLLTRRLHEAGVARVVGIDADADQIDLATTARPSETVGYLLGDVMDLDLGARFDLVTCYAALHHLGLEAGLRRLADLTAPGGSLLVVGLTRRTTRPVDAAWDLARLHGIRLSSRRHPAWWEHGAPVAEPEETHAELRRAASTITPGAVIRRRLYWRYSLVWRKPGVRAGR